jgi:uncharacterized protein
MIVTQHIGLDVGLSAELLDNIVDAVRAQARVKRIILYGSRTRGDFAPTSDIDIAVELEPSAHMLKSEIDEQIRTLLRVDIVDLSKVPQHLKDEILTTGVKHSVRLSRRSVRQRRSLKLTA